MEAIKLENGNLLIPKRAEDEEGKIIGDGMVEITPDDPDYKRWLPFVRDEKIIAY